MSVLTLLSRNGKGIGLFIPNRSHLRPTKSNNLQFVKLLGSYDASPWLRTTIVEKKREIEDGPIQELLSLNPQYIQGLPEEN